MGSSYSELYMKYKRIVAFILGGQIEWLYGGIKAYKGHGYMEFDECGLCTYYDVGGLIPFFKKKRKNCSLKLTVHFF